MRMPLPATASGGRERQATALARAGSGGGGIPMRGLVRLGACLVLGCSAGCHGSATAREFLVVNARFCYNTLFHSENDDQGGACARRKS